MSTDNNGKNNPSLDAFDHDVIRRLADLLEETNLSEIEVEQSGLRVRVARQLSIAATAPAMPASAQSPSPADVDASPGSASSDLAAHPGTVTSPMVGTAYLASQPGAPAYVKEGDTVSEGQTLMIVEAMKTMNPIPAPRSGTVTKILVENEQPVEFGEPLMLIE